MKDTERWILEAAVHLLGKNGFDRTTTKEIADRAGVHESTFFRIFKSKDALLVELLYALTPGPEDLTTDELTGGEDLRKDFEVFLYQNAMLHVKHTPIFRIALHAGEIYNQQRFSKIKAMVAQIGEYFQNLSQKGRAADFDYFALAEHINSLVLTKSFEFVTGEAFGIPAEKSARIFARKYAEYFSRILAPATS